MSNWIEFLTALVDETDALALKYFRANDLGVTIKPDRTPVSQGDEEIENHIRQMISDSHPELSIVGEEYGSTVGTSSTKLIIDPIDGTKNFIAGLPFFATLLAIEQEGDVIAGLVSAPETGDRWWAAKGKGAFHNGNQIQVSSVDSIDKSLVFFGSLYGHEASKQAEPVLNLLKQTYRQRGFGDYYQHMLVAMGKGEFSLDFNLKQWDIAPLKIIIEEAGGVCTDSSGEKTIHAGNAICSNGQFHQQIISTLGGLK